MDIGSLFITKSCYLFSLLILLPNFFSINSKHDFISGKLLPLVLLLLAWGSYISFFSFLGPSSCSQLQSFHFSLLLGLFYAVQEPSFFSVVTPSFSAPVNVILFDNRIFANDHLKMKSFEQILLQYDCVLIKRRTLDIDTDVSAIYKEQRGYQKLGERNVTDSPLKPLRRNQSCW